MKKIFVLILLTVIFVSVNAFAELTKCRVYYHPDGKVDIVYPSPNYPKKGGESETDWLARIYQETEIELGMQGLPFDDIDRSELPDRSNKMKWRGSKGNGIHIDNTIVTEREKKEAIEADLDAELAKPAPNAIKAMRLQRKLDKREYD